MYSSDRVIADKKPDLPGLLDLLRSRGDAVELLDILGFDLEREIDETKRVT